MTQQSLDLLARKLGKEEKRGWLTPEGDFFESDETPAVRITGLTLGGHEQAALLWLESNALENCSGCLKSAGFRRNTSAGPTPTGPT